MNKDMPDEIYIYKHKHAKKLNWMDAIISYDEKLEHHHLMAEYIRKDLAPAPKAAENVKWRTREQEKDYSDEINTLTQPKPADDLSQPNALPYVPLKPANNTQEHTLSTSPNNAALDGLLWMKQIIESKGEMLFDEHDLDATYEEILSALRNTTKE